MRKSVSGTKLIIGFAFFSNKQERRCEYYQLACVTTGRLSFIILNINSIFMRSKDGGHVSKGDKLCLHHSQRLCGVVLTRTFTSVSRKGYTALSPRVVAV
jgi:hypothetical protein